MNDRSKFDKRVDSSNGQLNYENILIKFVFFENKIITIKFKGK